MVGSCSIILNVPVKSAAAARWWWRRVQVAAADGRRGGSWLQKVERGRCVGPVRAKRATTSLSFDDLFGRVPRGSIPTNTCLGPVPDQTLIKSFLEEILHNESENHVYALLELYKFDKKNIYIYIYNKCIYII